MKRLLPIKEHQLQRRIRPLFIPLVFRVVDELVFGFEEGGEGLGDVEEGGAGGGGVGGADELRGRRGWSGIERGMGRDVLT